MITNPFNNKVQNGYDQYVHHLEKGELKNNSSHMKGIFGGNEKSFELPQIRSQGKGKKLMV